MTEYIQQILCECGDRYHWKSGKTDNPISKVFMGQLLSSECERCGGRGVMVIAGEDSHTEVVRRRGGDGESGG